MGYEKTLKTLKQCPDIVTTLVEIMKLEEVCYTFFMVCTLNLRSALYLLILLGDIIWRWWYYRRERANSFYAPFAQVLRGQVGTMFWLVCRQFGSDFLYEWFSLRQLLNSVILTLSVEWVGGQNLLFRLCIGVNCLIWLSGAASVQVQAIALSLFETVVIFILIIKISTIQSTVFSERLGSIKDFLMNFPEAILILDKENEVKFRNQEWHSLFERLKAKADKSLKSIGNSIFESNNSGVTLNTNLEQFRKDIEGSRQQKMIWVQEYFFNEKSSPESSHTSVQTGRKFTKITLFWQKRSVLDDSGDEIILFFQDVSDRSVLHERQLADNMKSVLISTMSHELRTPLNGMLGILNMICDQVYPTTLKIDFL